MDDEISIGTSGSTEVCTGFGVLLCLETFDNEVYGGVRFELHGSDTDTAFSTWSSTHTLETILSTSDYVGNPGRDSDVVLTSAVSLIFEKVEVFSANYTEVDGASMCSVARVPDIRWRPAIQGHTPKTIWDIVNVEIPKISDSLKITRDKLERNNM